jgi:hypothetical protein
MPKAAAQLFGIVSFENSTVIRHSSLLLAPHRFSLLH